MLLQILNERVFDSLQMFGNSRSKLWKREGEVSGAILRPIVVIGFAKMAPIARQLATFPCRT